jgi:5'-3' exonuclease
VTHRLLLDTSSLMYRAFFSIPSTVRDASGMPVNALHGYLDMTTRLIADRRPDECVHVYDDDWRPAPRVAAYAGYKAQRQPDPDGLPEQFELLRSALDAMGLPQAEAPGWEAEDAIGTLAARIVHPDRVEIVTGDRDLIQLVRDPCVSVLFTLKGVSNLAVYDEAGVEAKYGVPPSRYLDFAVLRGDPSDGLPGVRGVGEKTARELVRAFPDLATMVAETNFRTTNPLLARSKSLRAALRDAEGYLQTVREVAAIRTDLDVREWRLAPNDARVSEIAEAHRLAGPIARLRRALEGR